MIILDTCVLIFDSLHPQKLSSAAKKAILQAEEKNQLGCSDISLWEIAMLIQKKRLDPGVDTQTFLKLMLQAKKIQVLGITIEIAYLSTTIPSMTHFDPADRIIAATAQYHGASLITSDQKLRRVPEITTIW